LVTRCSLGRWFALRHGNLSASLGQPVTDAPAFSWVSTPFEICPACGDQTFGRLWVQRHSYVRKCENCGHRARIELPELRKTIVYLDQFAISGARFLQVGPQYLARTITSGLPHTTQVLSGGPAAYSRQHQIVPVGTARPQYQGPYQGHREEAAPPRDPCTRRPAPPVPGPIHPPRRTTAVERAPPRL
jgi:Zn ribbon nucleic-acid-binding protein